MNYSSFATCFCTVNASLFSNGAKAPRRGQLLFTDTKSNAQSDSKLRRNALAIIWQKKAELLNTKARPSLRNTIRGGTVRGWSNEMQGMHQSFDIYYIGNIFGNVQCQIVTPAMHKCMSNLPCAIFLRLSAKTPERPERGSNREAH